MFILKTLIRPTKIKKNSVYTLTTKILYPTRIKKTPCSPITNLQRTKRNTISRKKGINYIEPENEGGLKKI